MATLPDFFQEAYHNTWTHELQQKNALYAGTYQQMAVNGNRLEIPYLDKSDDRELTGRAQKLQLDEDTQFKRWLYVQNYGRTHKIDEWDEKNLGTYAVPSSQYIQNDVYMYHRRWNTVIYDALGGVAKTGTDGTTDTSLPSSQIVEEDFQGDGVSASDVGLTFEKVKKASRILDDNFVPLENRFFTVSPAGQDDLLGEAEANNQDFTMNRIIDAGTINGMTWMGFRWIVDPSIPKTVDGAGYIRNYYAWHPSCLAFGDGEKRTTAKSELLQSEALVIYTRYRMGATRLEEEGVVEVQAWNAS